MLSIETVNFTKKKLPIKDIKAAALFIAKSLKLSGEISLVFASDRRLHTLNKRFRGFDKPTDVLTFSGPEDNGLLGGEIVVNLADCARPYKYREVFSEPKSFLYTLYFLIIHGLLHLAGEEDNTEKGRLKMISWGEKLMKKIKDNDIIEGKL